MIGGGYKMEWFIEYFKNVENMDDLPLMIWFGKITIVIIMITFVAENY